MIVMLVIFSRIKGKKITIEENEDRVYWRPKGDNLITSFKLGKVIYQPESVIVQDANGAEIFKSSLASVEVNGGTYQQGGWVLTSADSTQGVHLVMRPHGNLMLFWPFAERKAEQRLLKNLNK